MRQSPSIVPRSNLDVHLVLDDFGHLGQVWREANVEDTDIETVIPTYLTDSTRTRSESLPSTHPRDGRAMFQRTSPDLEQRCVDHMLELPAGLQEFVGRYAVRAS